MNFPEEIVEKIWSEVSGVKTLNEIVAWMNDPVLRQFLKEELKFIILSDSDYDYYFESTYRKMPKPQNLKELILSDLIRFVSQFPHLEGIVLEEGTDATLYFDDRDTSQLRLLPRGLRYLSIEIRLFAGPIIADPKDFFGLWINHLLKSSLPELRSLFWNHPFLDEFQTDLQFLTIQGELFSQTLFYQEGLWSVFTISFDDFLKSIERARTPREDDIEAYVDFSSALVAHIAERYFDYSEPRITLSWEELTDQDLYLQPQLLEGLNLEFIDNPSYEGQLRLSLRIIDPETGENMNFHALAVVKILKYLQRLLKYVNVDMIVSVQFKDYKFEILVSPEDEISVVTVEYSITDWMLEKETYRTNLDILNAGFLQAYLDI